MRLLPEGRLHTDALATEPIDLAGVLDGNLYLRGGGDPTLTLPELDRLAVELVADAGLAEITGQVLGDESAFDTLRGVPSSRYQTSAYVGPLGALVVNRGRTGRVRPYWQASPADWAADAFVSSLRRAGVRVGKTAGRVGLTPPGALPLATHESPPVSTLIRLANVPSDNYIAETLLKAIGAAGGAVGTTSRGATMVRSAMGDVGVRPKVSDGSGLSRSNRTTPRHVVRLLTRMADDDVFSGSLAVAGRSGTLQDRMRSSYARGRCRGKTGSLISVSNVAGYCLTASGDTLAFAILMNGVNPFGARALQDRMVGAIARYEP
jgi:D-alanyl-D-alanine carboxypeptidase/D-alanyl-D-alanine-endopeptidase (penicillin-binding protein 4)